MKLFRYVHEGRHDTGPPPFGATIGPDDIIILLARVECYRIILMPSGQVRCLSYPFEEQPYFVEICP